MLTIAIRSIVAAQLMDNFEADHDGYAHIAEVISTESLYGRRGLFSEDLQESRSVSRPIPTAYRPPLYPMILSCLVEDGKIKRPAVAVLHVILAAVTVYLIFLFAWHQGLGKFSFVVAMGVAIDPLLLQQSTMVMTETIAALCAVAGVVAINRFYRVRSLLSAVNAGVFFAIGIACRPIFLVWAALICFVLLKDVIRGRLKLLPALVVPITISLIVLPWIVRNQCMIGKPVVATTHGGYTLLLANNESLFEHQRGKWWPDVWEPDERFKKWNQNALEVAGNQHRDTSAASNAPTSTVNSGDNADSGVSERSGDSERSRDSERSGDNQQGQHWELHYDQLCNAKVKQVISEQPLAFVKATVFRVIQLWNPLPNAVGPESRTYVLLRYLVGGWYVIVLALAATALWKMREKLLSDPWCWPALLILATTMVHAFYWSNIRMRAPATPFLYLFAVYAIARFLSSRRRKRKRRIRRDR